jgi:hypothetical protein
VLYWGGIIGSAVILSECIRRFVARFDTPGPLACRPDRQRTHGAFIRPAITVFNALALGHDGMFGVALGTNVLVVLLVCFGVVMFRAYIRHYTGDGDVAAPEIFAGATMRNPGFPARCRSRDRRSMRWIEADDHYLRACPLRAAPGS